MKLLGLSLFCLLYPGYAPLAVALPLVNPFAGENFSLRTDANVYENDTRKEITTDSAPWTAIGKLVDPDGGWCSATLVSPDLILTAAHCIMKEGEVVFGEYRFYPAYKKGKKNAYATIKHMYWGTKTPAKHRSQDWAILRLGTALGHTYGWLGVREVDLLDDMQDKRLYMAGYPKDLGRGAYASWQKDCEFTAFDETDGTYLHNCHMTKGASGAPMFFYTDPASPRDSGRIVAINVAENIGTNDTDSLVGIPYRQSRANVAVAAREFLPKLLELRGND